MLDFKGKKQQAHTCTPLTCADITSEAIRQPIHECADNIDPHQCNLTPNEKETNQLKTSTITNCRTAFPNT